MSVRLLTPSLQITLQGAPRTGLRHMGVPSSGPADPLSMALANRLVSNASNATAMEITYGGVALEFTRRTLFALVGGQVELDGVDDVPHKTQIAEAGTTLHIRLLAHGARLYLAVAGGFVAETLLGSTSTYLPAGFGGHQGRALQPGDEVAILPALDDLPILSTPKNLQLPIGHSFALRAVPSGEYGLLSANAAARLFEQPFMADRQLTRMGIPLSGAPLEIDSDGRMKSAPVFPGTIQCPESGNPIILLSDAGTTGGYPRIAAIARCDLHLLGQIRPGDQIRFIRRSQSQAASDYSAKAALLKNWLPDFVL
ncbi:MAG: biotin-dependent carboxyltransferase family protein [Henriciella sp.]